MLGGECISRTRLQRKTLHMEENWVETAEQEFIVLSTTTVVPFDEPEAGVRPDLVMIIQMDFFREAMREDLDSKLRRPTHVKLITLSYLTNYVPIVKLILPIT